MTRPRPPRLGSHRGLICPICKRGLRKSPGIDGYVCSGPGACQCHYSGVDVRNYRFKFELKQ